LIELCELTNDLALISADEYKRLRELDQQAFYAHELPSHIINGLGSESIPEEAYEFSHEYAPE
jgi:hypothetical protein